MTRASKRQGSRNKASGANPELAKALPILGHRAGFQPLKKHKGTRQVRKREALRDQQVPFGLLGVPNPA